jgi:hypothetical protein
MSVRRTRWLVLGAACAVAAGAAVTAALLTAGPAADRAQARAMLPAIDAYLDKDAGHLGFGYLSPRLKPRVFCDADILDVVPDGRRWRVSMVMNCGEFARRGQALVEGAAGYPGIGEVVTLTGHSGKYRALALMVGPPYYDTVWADRNLSPDAAAEVLSANPPTAPDPISQARRAFSFPPGTIAVQG